jgi:hypothetical protein
METPGSDFSVICDRSRFRCSRYQLKERLAKVNDTLHIRKLNIVNE